MQKLEREKTTDTSFIINAFQDVTKQLKEKEKELERLKALAEQRAENVETYNENILQCVTSGVMTFDKDCHLDHDKPRGSGDARFAPGTGRRHDLPGVVRRQ